MRGHHHLCSEEGEFKALYVKDLEPFKRAVNHKACIRPVKANADLCDVQAVPLSIP